MFFHHGGMILKSDLLYNCYESQKEERDSPLKLFHCDSRTGIQYNSSHPAEYSWLPLKLRQQYTLSEDQCKFFCASEMQELSQIIHAIAQCFLFLMQRKGIPKLSRKCGSVVRFPNVLASIISPYCFQICPFHFFQQCFVIPLGCPSWRLLGSPVWTFDTRSIGQEQISWHSCWVLLYQHQLYGWLIYSPILTCPGTF